MAGNCTALDFGEASFDFAFSAFSAAARLPLSAVMQQQGQPAVWVLDKTSMTVKVQPVVVGGADGNTVVIASGLSPGQTVVTAGVHTLTPGQKVKLFEAPAPSAAASGAAPAASR